MDRRERTDLDRYITREEPIEEDKRMNPALKSAWLTALRSGDFSQSTNALHPDDGFCCLGVLCEVAAARGLLPPGYEWNGRALIRGRDEEGQLVEAAEELPHPDDFGLTGHDQEELTRMNDGRDDSPQRSFEFIAAWIEENVS